jgi:hypothetical protein
MAPQKAGGELTAFYGGFGEADGRRSTTLQHAAEAYLPVPHPPRPHPRAVEQLRRQRNPLNLGIVAVHHNDIRSATPGWHR